MSPPVGRSPLHPIQRALLGLVLAAAGYLAMVAPDPPRPIPATAPPGEFSAERAMVHVQAIARRPHPLGSPASATVREYLVGELGRLGLEPVVQRFPLPGGNPEVAGVNVMARLTGARGSAQSHRMLALVCHYDSVRTGPGASDDGAGVATLLETARALLAAPALPNDVLLLFTDGEEGGLDGARAFAAHCPWMQEIGLVLNFEARGVSGPVFMFETGAGNGPVIRGVAEAAPRPVANSLMYEVYRRMPNDTDFTIFKHAGLPGLNFAFIGEPRHYHAPTDDPAHLSRASLQHEGSYALALTRYFASLDLADAHGPDVVYFDLFGRWLVYYPVAWALPLALLVGLLFLGATARELRGGQASPAKLVLGGLAWALDLAVVGVVFRYALDAAGWVARGVPGGLEPWLGWPYWATAAVLTVAASAALYRGLRHWLAPSELALGALFWWLVLALVTALGMPGGSYLGLGPVLFGLLALSAPRGVRQTPWLWLAWLAVAGLPTVVLLAPLVRGIFVALGPRAMFIPMLLLALGLGALASQLEGIIGGGASRARRP